MKESKMNGATILMEDGRKSREALTSDSTIFACKVGNAITNLVYEAPFTNVSNSVWKSVMCN